MGIRRIGGFRGLGRIDSIRGLPEYKGVRELPVEIGGADMSRDVADDLDEEFRAAVGDIGEEYARIAQRMRQQGNGGTIPEMLAQDWLLRRRIPFITQVTIPEASARVDIIVREEIAIRIQGVYWHRPGNLHDDAQKYALRLMGLTPVDAWEDAIYRARDYVMSAAIRGREVGRAYNVAVGGQRGLARRQ